MGHTSLDGLQWTPLHGPVPLKDREGEGLLDASFLTNNGFVGNVDRSSPVENYFRSPAQGRYVRIIPVAYHIKAGLRVGLLCDACSERFQEHSQCSLPKYGPGICRDARHPMHLWAKRNCWRMCDPGCLVKQMGCPYDLSKE